MNKVIKPLKNWLLLSKDICNTNTKKLILFGVCILQTLVFKSQIANYITNGSFEAKYNCSWPNSVCNIKGWRSIDSNIFAATSYFNNCYGNVPYGLSFQYPRTGSSFVTSSHLCQPPQCSSTNNKIDNFSYNF